MQNAKIGNLQFYILHFAFFAPLRETNITAITSTHPCNLSSQKHSLRQSW